MSWPDVYPAWPPEIVDRFGVIALRLHNERGIEATPGMVEHVIKYGSADVREAISTVYRLTNVLKNPPCNCLACSNARFIDRQLINELIIGVRTYFSFVDDEGALPDLDLPPFDRR